MTGLARYEKLKTLLKDKIVSGKFKPGDRFFSQNDLIGKYNLSFSTVTRALDELVREGYLVRQRGKGTFINSVKPEGAFESPPKKAFLFSPWSTAAAGIGSPASLYQQLEVLRPDDLHLKFIPHGSNPDDLEPFLFSRENFDVAVFLYPLEVHFDFIEKLADSLPVVVLATSPKSFAGHLVYTSFFSAASMATRHLLEFGHRNIAVIGGLPDQAAVSDFCEGYRAALKADGVPYVESLISVTSSAPAAYCDFSNVLARNSDRVITAALAMDSVSALEILSELQAMSKSVPDDFSILFFDDLNKASYFPRPLSAVSFPLAELARTLLATIQTAQRDSTPTVTPVVPQFELRSSTSACKSCGPH